MSWNIRSSLPYSLFCDYVSWDFYRGVHRQYWVTQKNVSSSFDVDRLRSTYRLIENMSCQESSNPILHVLVIGFHHKKGCQVRKNDNDMCFHRRSWEFINARTVFQVEYAYPPLSPEHTSDSNDCPPGWKYLPTLALPDGSHNYTHDTVYFHLPSLSNPNQTVFGISCYRQISVEVNIYIMIHYNLKRSEVTRTLWIMF